MMTKLPRASERDLIPMEVLERVGPMIKVVAHPVRLRILDYLRAEDAPRTVSEIEAACGAPQPVVSLHLRILRDQGVLIGERSGNFVYYAIAAPSVLLILECIRKHEARPEE